MSLLRTIATFCEKTNGASTQHHMLLLSPHERREVSMYRQCLPLREGDNVMHDWSDMSGDISGGGGGGGGDNAGGGELSKYPLKDPLKSVDDKDNDISFGSLLCLSCVSINCDQCCKDKTSQVLKRREDEEKYYSMYTSNSLQFIGASSYVSAAAPSSSSPSSGSMQKDSVGLIQDVVDALLKQPPTSPFYYEMASTVHKWLQGAMPIEQDLMLRRPGFVAWIVDQLLVVESQPKQQAKVTGNLPANNSNSGSSSGVGGGDEPNPMCAFPRAADVQQVIREQN
jgi:hypothetical protein